MKKRKRFNLVERFCEGLSWKYLLSGVFVIFIGLLIWMNFFYFSICDNQECFDRNLETCSRAEFVRLDDMVFKYNILRRFDGKCVVNVELLSGDLSNKDSDRLEGNEMECYLNRGEIVIPESNMGDCHGLLKEGLQELVISKLHRHIVENLGELGEELGL